MQRTVCAERAAYFLRAPRIAVVGGSEGSTDSQEKFNLKIDAAQKKLS
jgi:hypothetical protein